MKANWQLILLSTTLALAAWGGREIYTEIRSTHDAVLKLQTGTEIEIAAIKVRLAAVELEVQKLKQKP